MASGRDGAHVLIVDDEPGMRSALVRALRREPYAVETASNADEALARLAQSPEIDLVVSDYKMPGMTGLALLARIRQSHPRTARILLSGWTAEIASEEAASAAPSAMLAKPWDDGELKASITSALEEASRR